MQTVGPFRLRQALGTCQVGGVWSATDALDNQVTVAVLTANVGRDPGWRNAFAAAANGLAQAGQLPMVAADFAAATPWIASAAGDGSVVAQVFVVLGMVYQPLAADPGEWGGPEPPAPDEPTQPVAAVASPPAAAVPPQPPPPQPAAAVPAPSAATVLPQRPPPDAPQPEYGAPLSPASVAWPYDPVVAGRPPPGRSRRRTALLVGVVVLGLVVLGGGGAGIAFALRPDPGGPTPTPTIGGTAPAPTLATQPGIEPPVDGEWPADWPTFEAQEPVTPITDLAGVGFAFELPAGWDCASVANTDELVHYTCGLGGDADQIGGDLITRPCPDPCDGDRRVQMRMAVEAWGLQWVRDGGFRNWAETGQVADEQRYGLVIAGYWRTATEGRIDRQLVFRMTAPIDQADEIRKLANSIREAIA